jgi:25S rRNA (adenine2142-N1)-methyltransferase
MPKARKRKTPIVQANNDAPTSSKPEVTRSVIREFHVLLKKQAQLQKNRTQDATTSSELSDIQKRIDELGGLERYQHMSATGQKDDRGGGSQKILIGWMKELGLHRRGADAGKLKFARSPSLVSMYFPDSSLQIHRLLEVGALLPDNYQSCSSWIDNHPIDLNSRHPAIQQQDFFLLDRQENFEKWSVISLSLVVNFVPEPKDRGMRFQPVPGSCPNGPTL